MEYKKIIVRVWKNNITKQKMISVPKNCELEAGDYVELVKIK